MLGEDSKGEINGKRVMSLFTARFAARELLKEWKGMNGAELDEFIDSDEFNKIFKEFDY